MIHCRKQQYREGEVAALCKEFGWASSVAAVVFREFAIFKKTNGKQTGPNLHAYADFRSASYFFC